MSAGQEQVDTPSIAFDGGLARIVLTGRFDFESWRAAFERLVTHESFRPGMPCLWDIQRAETSTVGRDTILRIADYMKAQGERRGRGKTGIVASRDLEFGVARMYQGMSASTNPVDFGVYRTAEEAERWLRS